MTHERLGGATLRSVREGKTQTGKRVYGKENGTERRGREEEEGLLKTESIRFAGNSVVRLKKKYYRGNCKKGRMIVSCSIKRISTL